MRSLRLLLLLTLLALTDTQDGGFLTVPEEDGDENAAESGGLPPILQDMVLELQALRGEVREMREAGSGAAGGDGRLLREMQARLERLEKQQAAFLSSFSKMQAGVLALENRLLQLEEDEEIPSTGRIDWGFTSTNWPRVSTTDEGTIKISWGNTKRGSTTWVKTSTSRPPSTVNPTPRSLSTANPLPVTTALPYWTKSSLSCRRTQRDALGPYYKDRYEGKDQVCTRDPRFNLDKLVVHGYVFDSCGQPPISEALVEVWQADSKGNYVDNCRGQVRTDRNGYYRLTTVFPGYYNPRPRHLHFKVTAGTRRPMVTQMYFVSHPDGGWRYPSLSVKVDPLPAYNLTQFNFVFN